jgi:hypothetical protein
MRAASVSLYGVNAQLNRTVKTTTFFAKNSDAKKSDKSSLDKSSMKGSPAELSPLDKVKRAAQEKLESVPRIAEEKRLQDQADFLKKPFGTVNGETFTGLDVLKVVDAAIQKRFFKRDWIHFSMLSGFTLGSAGTLFMMKAFRKDFALSLRPGLPEGEFEQLMAGFEDQWGHSVHFRTAYFELSRLGLIESTSGYRVVLSREARKLLTQKS